MTLNNIAANVSLNKKKDYFSYSIMGASDFHFLCNQ